jgi:hypothetical protein
MTIYYVRVCVHTGNRKPVLYYYNIYIDIDIYIIYNILYISVSRERGKGRATGSNYESRIMILAKQRTSQSCTTVYNWNKTKQNKGNPRGSNQ